MRSRIRATVRYELSLRAKKRPLPQKSNLSAIALSTLLLGLCNSTAVAQPPYQQELIPAFSSLTVDRYSNPDFADLDGDGDSDVVVGDFYGNIRFFQNTGSSTSPSFVMRLGTADPFEAINVGGYGSPELADLDGDGDLDATIGEAGGTLLFFENTGSSSSPAFRATTGSANPFNGIDVGQRTSLELADVDGDGDLDAVLGTLDGTLRYYKNTGSSGAAAFVETTGTANPLATVDVGDRSSPEIVDLDGDGDLDTVVGESGGDLLYFENTGTSTAPLFVERTGVSNPFDFVDAVSRSSPDIVDLDGDEDLDLVVGEFHGSFHYFINTGSTAVPAFVEVAGAENPFRGIDVGEHSLPAFIDLDADGDQDVVSGERLGTLIYFENTGNSNTPSFEERTGSENPFDGIDVGLHSSPGLGDLDGDGDFDAVVGEDNVPVQYFENTGSSTEPAFLERTGTANPLAGASVDARHSPDLVDLDGDGDLDAVVGERTGALRYYENTGSSTAPAFVERVGGANPLTGIDMIVNDSTPGLVDFDADGDVDAVFGERFGGLRYFRNTGNSMTPAFVWIPGTASPFHLIDVEGYSKPQIVDLDGDGDLDMLAGQGGGRLIFFRSLFAGALLFADGFESGDTSAWSAMVPP